jgi:hypothetical protein
MTILDAQGAKLPEDTSSLPAREVGEEAASGGVYDLGTHYRTLKAKWRLNAQF